MYDPAEDHLDHIRALREQLERRHMYNEANSNMKAVFKNKRRDSRSKFVDRINRKAEKRNQAMLEKLDSLSTRRVSENEDSDYAAQSLKREKEKFFKSVHNEYDSYLQRVIENRQKEIEENLVEEEGLRQERDAVKRQTDTFLKLNEALALTKMTLYDERERFHSESDALSHAVTGKPLTARGSSFRRSAGNFYSSGGAQGASMPQFEKRAMTPRENSRRDLFASMDMPGFLTPRERTAFNFRKTTQGNFFEEPHRSKSMSRRSPKVISRQDTGDEDGVVLNSESGDGIKEEPIPHDNKMFMALKDREREIEDMKEEVEELRSQRIDQQNTLNKVIEMQVEGERLQSQMETLNAAKIFSEDRVRQLESDLKETFANISTLEAEKRRLEGKMSQKIDHTVLQDTKRRYEETILDLEKRIKEQGYSLASSVSQETFQKLKEVKNQVELELETIRINNAREKNRLQSENSELTLKADHLNNKVKLLEENNSEFMERNRELQRTFLQKQQEYLQLSSTPMDISDVNQIADLTQQLQAKDREISRLKSEKEYAQNQLKSIENQLKTHQTNLTGSETQNTTLQSQLTSLKQQNFDLSTERDDLRTTIQRMTAIQSNLQSAMNENDLLRSQLSSQQQLMSQKDYELQNLRQQVANLQAKFDENDSAVRTYVGQTAGHRVRRDSSGSFGVPDDAKVTGQEGRMSFRKSLEGDESKVSHRYEETANTMEMSANDHTSLVAVNAGKNLVTGTTTTNGLEQSPEFGKADHSQYLKTTAALNAENSSVEEMTSLDDEKMNDVSNVSQVKISETKVKLQKAESSQKPDDHIGQGDSLVPIPMFDDSFSKNQAQGSVIVKDDAGGKDKDSWFDSDEDDDGVKTRNPGELTSANLETLKTSQENPFLRKSDEFSNSDGHNAWGSPGDEAGAGKIDPSKEKSKKNMWDEPAKENNTVKEKKSSWDEDEDEFSFTPLGYTPTYTKKDPVVVTSETKKPEIKVHEDSDDDLREAIGREKSTNEGVPGFGIKRAETPEFDKSPEKKTSSSKPTFEEDDDLIEIVDITEIHETKPQKLKPLMTTPSSDLMKPQSRTNDLVSPQKGSFTNSNPSNSMASSGVFMTSTKNSMVNNDQGLIEEDLDEEVLPDSSVSTVLKASTTNLSDIEKEDSKKSNGKSPKKKDGKKSKKENLKEVDLSALPSKAGLNFQANENTCIESEYILGLPMSTREKMVSLISDRIAKGLYHNFIIDHIQESEGIEIEQSEAFLQKFQKSLKFTINRNNLIMANVLIFKLIGQSKADILSPKVFENGKIDHTTLVSYINPQFRTLYSRGLDVVIACCRVQKTLDAETIENASFLLMESIVNFYMSEDVVMDNMNTITKAIAGFVEEKLRKSSPKSFKKK